jgi:hypothetical protein
LYRYSPQGPDLRAPVNGGGRPPVGILETLATVEFFKEHTVVRSGAKTTTRRMPKSMPDMYILYRAHFPTICRRARALSESLVINERLSPFVVTALVVADRLASDPEWSLPGEWKHRLAWYQKRLATQRLDRAVQGSHSGEGQNWPSLATINVGDDPDGIKARSFQTFWTVLKRGSVKWLRSEPIHSCPIHEQGPKYIKKLERLQGELNQLNDDLVAHRLEIDHRREQARAAAGVGESEDHADEGDEGAIVGDDTEAGRVLRSHILATRGDLRTVTIQVDKYRTHLKEFQLARRYAKYLELHLTALEIMIYRDFVNQYNEEGTRTHMHTHTRHGRIERDRQKRCRDREGWEGDR